MIRSRRGFTLIELLVALMVFTIGLLALASGASGIMAMLGSSQARTVASGVAASRFEKLRPLSCPRAAGADTIRGIAEAWTVTSFARADDVVVTITMTSEHRQKIEKFASYLPC